MHLTQWQAGQADEHLHEAQGIKMDEKSKSPALDSHEQKCRSLYEHRLKLAHEKLIAAMECEDPVEADHLLEDIRGCKEALALLANG